MNIIDILTRYYKKIRDYISSNYQPKGSYASSDHNHNSAYLGISAIAESAKSADSVAWSNVSGKPSTYTPSSHTHNYAGSPSAGGAASSTLKIETYKQGSTTETYGASYPIFAQWVDNTNVALKCTNYTVWVDKANSVAWGNVSDKPSSYTPSSHTHDDRYYTESEINTKLSGKSDTSHTHSNYLTGITKAMVTTALGYTPPTSDTNTWNALKGSTTSAAGTAGYAPAPAAGAANRYLRCDGTWQVPPDNNTTYSFSNKAATLAWNTAVTVATVGGVDITVKLPANPNTNTTYSAGSNITLSGTTFSLTKANVVGALGYTPPTTNTTYSKLSQFTNDSGYITSSGSCNYATSAGNGVDSYGNNWIRFKSKTQICWGTAVISGTSGTVTYPKAFANTDYCPPTICFGDNVQYDNYLSVDDWNTSGFKIARTGPSGNARFNYICIGTWS